ncbi:YdjY domain-containing protein [Planctomicrobium sp. SH527]|uniref:YdjY domain-containing protein n=1 Tax=Planctomicrobium sp. SH527 TaxID=3448123 RepID=UPI003F5B838D
MPCTAIGETEPVWETNHMRVLVWTTLVCAVVLCPNVWGMEPMNAQSIPVPETSETISLNPEETVLFDKMNGKLVLKTKVCLREGLLEMLLCPKQTKEHESILTIDSKAQVIHAGLLALGAKPGHPVKYKPEFQPPQGQQIEIFVNWMDEKGKKHRERVQKWIRHATQRYFHAPCQTLPPEVKLVAGDKELKYDHATGVLIFFGQMTPEEKKVFLSRSQNAEYQKAIESLFQLGQLRELDATFVFAGSGFSKLANGREVYQAEGGSLICVANFGDALLDINIASTASNDSGLMFEPWTERIPPLGTEVLVELIPVMSASVPAMQ